LAIRTALGSTLVGAVMAVCSVPADAIVEGHLTSRSAHPWFVDIGERCAGALVLPKRVVTSANCLNGESLAAGAHLRIAHARRRVLGVAFSPGWVRHEGELADLCRADPGCRFQGHLAGRYCGSGMPCPDDLAIIEIDKAVKGVSPVHVARPRPGLRARALGDGDTTADPLAPHEHRLRSAELVVLADAACRRALRRQELGSLTGLEEPGALCARASQGAAAACYGDEGGPLVRRDGRRWHLYGIASWHDGCGRGQSPSVYAEVRRFSAFVFDAKPSWRPRLQQASRLLGVKAAGRTLSCTIAHVRGQVGVTIYTFLSEAPASRHTSVRRRGVSPKYVVQDQDRGTKLACTVEVRNRHGIDQDSVTVQIDPGRPATRPGIWNWPPAPTLRPIATGIDARPGPTFH
jgi:hypothetical protein